MISALWTGISGLATQQKALDNEAHNIANVNTVGYKASRISFADQLYQDKIGKGSKVLDAEKIFTQGGRKLTGVSYDLALNGEGFFSVSNKSEAGTSETYYTRAGNFRMGDNGTLQDAQGNEVQGWAMRPIDEQKDVTTTNPDSSVFTDDYNKLLSSKVIKHSTYIETITAKATKYDETAVKDAELIFGGAGAKSKAAKVSDVEELVKAYTTALQRLQEDPDGLSSTSTPQVSQLNFKGDTLKKDGDQIYVYINGNKISQGFVSVVADPTLLPSEVGDLTKDGNITVEDADLAASRIATYKALADKISEIPGFKATTISNGTAYDATDDSTYYSNNFSVNDIFKNSTKDLDVLHGMIQITSLIPGESFVIKEHAEVSGNQVTQGSLNISGSQTDSVKGTGLGDVESIKSALIDAVSGKQRDVFTPSDLGILYNGASGLITSPTEFNYEISIYDKDLQKNVTIKAASTPLSTSVIGTSLENVLDDFASKINNDINLKDYIKASVVNGNIVIETLNKNSDVEFSGTLNGNKTIFTPVSLVDESHATAASVDTAIPNATSTFTIPTTIDYPFTGTIPFSFDYNAAATPIVVPTGPYADADALGAAIAAAINLDGTATATYASGQIVLATVATPATDTITVPTFTLTGPGILNGTNTSKTNIATTSVINENSPLPDTLVYTLPAATVNFPVSNVTFSYTDGVSVYPETLTGPFNTMDEIGEAMKAAANLNSFGSAIYNDATNELTITSVANTAGSDFSAVSNVVIDQEDITVLDINDYSFPLAATDTIELTFNDNGTPVNIQVNPSIYATADDLANAIVALSGGKVTNLAGVITMTAANTTDTMTNAVLRVTENVVTKVSGAILDKNADYSGRQGAGGEFIEIITRIDQTTTQDSLQLRLDSLGISNSAFGEFSVDDTGLITMKQDGAEFAIGQIAIAKFNNMRGLDAIGDNLYAKTNNSGDAIFNINNNKTATIESASLELSTADLSESLVNLMVFQRAFEANAKSITTADQLLTTLIALKR